MPITEFAILPLIPPNTPLSGDLPKLFKLLMKQQSSWSKYSLYFYSDLATPSTVYLISGWDDVAAHRRWIDSEENKELIRIFSPYMNMQGLRLLHLDVDFTTFPPEKAGFVVLQTYDGKIDGLGKMSWKAVGKDFEAAAGDVYLIRAYETQEDIVLHDRQDHDLMVMRQISIPRLE